MTSRNQQSQILLFRHGEDGFTNELCSRLFTHDLDLIDLLPGNISLKNECIESIYIRPTSGNRYGFGEPDAVFITNHRLIFVESKFYLSNGTQKFGSKKINLGIPNWIYQLDRHVSHLDTIVSGKTKGPVKLTLACIKVNNNPNYSNEDKKKLRETLESKLIFHKAQKDCHKNWIAEELYEGNEIEEDYKNRAEKGFVLFIHISDQDIAKMKKKAIKSILRCIKDSEKDNIRSGFGTMFEKKVKILSRQDMDQTTEEWKWTERWFGN